MDTRQIPTAKAFLDTAALIPAGEQQFWGSDPEGIREVSALLAQVTRCHDIFLMSSAEGMQDPCSCNSISVTRPIQAALLGGEVCLIWLVCEGTGVLSYRCPKRMLCWMRRGSWWSKGSPQRWHSDVRRSMQRGAWAPRRLGPCPMCCRLQWKLPPPAAVWVPG